jgi:transcription antitermination factor NusG
MTDVPPNPTVSSPSALTRRDLVSPQGDLLRVIYIAAHSRSGTTLVGSLIGMLDDCCFVGEVWAAWTDGVHANRMCGCGRAFRDCPFWTDVFRRAFGGFDTPASCDAERAIARLQSTGDALRFWSSMWRRGSIAGDATAYQKALRPFYAAIRDVSGGKVIVDSSKLLRYGALIASMPDVDIRFVNVVRDVRGVVLSRASPALMRDGDMRHAGGADTSRYRIMRVVSRWVGRNELSMRLIDRFGGLRVPYEEFVRDPRPVLAALSNDESAARALQELELGAVPEQHQLGGNWVRGLKLEPRETWRDELPRRVRIATTALAWPFLRRYRFENRGAGGLLPGRETGAPQ